MVTVAHPVGSRSNSSQCDPIMWHHLSTALLFSPRLFATHPPIPFPHHYFIIIDVCKNINNSFSFRCIVMSRSNGEFLGVSKTIYGLCSNRKQQKQLMISRAKTKVPNVVPKKKPSAISEPNLDDMIARRDYTGAIAVLEVSFNRLKSSHPRCLSLIIDSHHNQISVLSTRGKETSQVWYITMARLLCFPFGRLWKSTSDVQENSTIGGQGRAQSFEYCLLSLFFGIVQRGFRRNEQRNGKCSSAKASISSCWEIGGWGHTPRLTCETIGRKYRR